ncbi:hypothetical protein [Propionicimonas sp.]|jgi:hypothetical protein|nr:hypothetical protein [Propionicimonas sp.]
MSDRETTKPREDRSKLSMPRSFLVGSMPEPRKVQPADQPKQ